MAKPLRTDATTNVRQTSGPSNNIGELIRNRIETVGAANREVFIRSVRPVYFSPDGFDIRPAGTCILLNVDGSHFIATAAHIFDLRKNNALCVGGMVGTPLPELRNEFIASPMPGNGRRFDALDFAFTRVSASEAASLGPVIFLGENSIRKIPNSSIGRVHMALGYPLGSNRGKKNTQKRTLISVSRTYYSRVSPKYTLKKFGITKKRNITLEFQKFSRDYSGLRVSSINPVGMSGGAVIDLGSFASNAALQSSDAPIGKLCGLLTARYKEQHAVVATRLDLILKAIKQNTK